MSPFAAKPLTTLTVGETIAKKKVGHFLN